MTSSLISPTRDDLQVAKERNLRIWNRSCQLLYARRIDEFVQTWTEDGRYEAALPVPGIPR